MTRKDFQAQLECVAPALSDSNLIPILSHFWFTGKTVLAFNDQIAIETPCVTPFKGAVPGTLFLNLLKASGASNIDFSTEGSILRVKMGVSKVRLPLLDPEAFIFKMPDSSKMPSVPDGMLDAINSCMRSISTDTSEPEQLGVTLIAGEDVLRVFATDSATISHVRLKTRPAFKGRAILSAAFCTQLLRFKKSEDMTFNIVQKDKETYSIARSGDTVIFGHLIHVPKPIDFVGMFNQHVPADVTKRDVKLPPNLKRALERACIIAEKTQTMIEIGEDQKMILLSKSDYSDSEIRDAFSVKGERAHPAIKVKIRPQLMLEGCKGFEDFLVTDSCCIMRKDNAFYLVSVT